MGKQDSIRTNQRKEIKRNPASTVTASFQSVRDRRMDELLAIVKTMNDDGLLVLTGSATEIAKRHPAQAKQNALIISMTEWRAAKAEVAS